MKRSFVEFKNPLNVSITHWKILVRAAGSAQALLPEEIDEFIRLLDQILRYENRPSARELLQSRLFKSDISFQLSSNFDPDDEISIFRMSDINYWSSQQDPFNQLYPSPALVIDKKTRVLRTCYHIPTDEQYLVEVKRPGVTFIPQYMSLVEGQTLEFGFQEVKPLTPAEPLQAPIEELLLEEGVFATDAPPSEILDGSSDPLPALFNL
jgi:preprotein translocase subunit Sss1